MADTGLDTMIGEASCTSLLNNGRSTSVSSDVDGDTQDINASTPAPISGEHEYETQFLGFTPKSFCDGLYNAVLDYTWEYFIASQEYIKHEFGDLVSREELHKASEIFLSTVSQQIDKAFDKFEHYVLSNILCVPANVVLPEDKVQQDYINFTRTDEQVLDADIHRLKQRIIAVKYSNASLRQEYRQLRVVQQESNQYLETLRKLHKTFKDEGVMDVRESLIFVVNKAQKVINLLEEMQRITCSKRTLPDISELKEVSKRIKSGDVHLV